MRPRLVARHCVTCVGCTEYSLANCETVLSPTRASNPTLALKAALCRLRFAFISLLSLISSRPAKVHLNQWSNFWGPPHPPSVAISLRRTGKERKEEDGDRWSAVSCQRSVPVSSLQAPHKILFRCGKVRKGAERIGKLRIVMMDCGWMDDGCGARWKALLPFLLRFGRDWSGLVRIGQDWSGRHHG